MKTKGSFMQFTLDEIARRVAGRLHGDGAIAIHGAATLSEAQPGDISLADDPRRAAEVARSAASAVITPAGFAPEGMPHIEVADVHEAFAAVVALFRPPRQRRRLGVSPRAFVSPTAVIAEDADVHAGAVIGDDVEIGPGCTVHSGACLMAGCKLGREVVVFPGAVLYEDTIVGDRVLIHAGAVLGAYGFGYKTIDGRHRLGAQLGYVKIENDVDIGAATTIDRGTYGPTVVAEGTKLDNQVMIGHNGCIGPHNIFCAQVGIAGSTSTGHYVIMAGQVGVRDHVHIGDLAVIGPQSGVKDSLPGRGRYQGTPCRPERENALLWSSFSKLPELRKSVKALMKELELLRDSKDGRSNHAA
jgi:UDP-3-O-[3-hydroxymyristoyl] glucosamine N-acyltransferase